MENPELGRVHLLMNQGRWKDAEIILGQLMLNEPDNTEVLTLMAEIKIQNDNNV